MVVKKGEHLREKETGKLYRVKRFEGDMVLIESKDSEEKLLVNIRDIKNKFTKTFATKLFNLTRIIIFGICITFALLGFFFLYLMSRARGDAFEAHAMMAMICFHLAIILFLLFYGGVWIYKGIIWMRKKL